MAVGMKAVLYEGGIASWDGHVITSRRPALSFVIHVFIALSTGDFSRVMPPNWCQENTLHQGADPSVSPNVLGEVNWNMYTPARWQSFRPASSNTGKMGKPSLQQVYISTFSPTCRIILFRKYWHYASCHFRSYKKRKFVLSSTKQKL